MIDNQLLGGLRRTNPEWAERYSSVLLTQNVRSVFVHLLSEVGLSREVLPAKLVQ